MAAELLGVLGGVVPPAGASAGALCAGVVVLSWLCWTTAFGPLRGRGGLVGVVLVAVGVCVEVVVGVEVVGVVAVAVGVVAVLVVVVLGAVLTGASAGALADGPPPGPVTVGAWAAGAVGASTAPAPVSAAVKPPRRSTRANEPF